MTEYRKKLIEVALPLPEINDASAYDKMPGIGPHPKGIHQWWARLPLPTARAVLFASVVDDPSERPEKFPTEDAQNTERERLFDIIRRMMQKKLHEHPEIYAEARAEMLKHCDGKLPPLFDPFSGGGSIPLEANRLGFESHAGDLNPVAVLLNKCNLELAPRWAGRPPVNPEDRERIGGTDGLVGTHGLAADVRYYGRLIEDRARVNVGHLYPKVRLPKKYGGAGVTVIAWLWTRTVASPNPAAHGKHVPLMSTYWLCTKKGSETWLKPVVDKAAATYHFEVCTGTPTDKEAIRRGTKTGRGAKFKCLLTDAPISESHIKSEGQAGKFGLKMVAVVADLGRGRCYLSVTDEIESAANASCKIGPNEELPYNSRYLTPPGYGIKSLSQYFTGRQLTTIVTLSELVKDIRADIRRDAAAATQSMEAAEAYSRDVSIFLALALDRCVDFNNTLCRWKPSGQQSLQLFARGAIPMVWDFAEPNLMGDKAVCWHTAVEICADAIETIAPYTGSRGIASQIDAATSINGLRNLLVSTDPPYYDNIPYAAISDFFYVWLRRTIGDFFPDLFSTVLVPKLSELTALANDERDSDAARNHFEAGFRKSFSALRERMASDFPLTVYYAFKQDDEEDDWGEEVQPERSVDLTTGWETLLEALIGAGFQITATWPVRASQQWRIRAMSSNALASYIVLACRPRTADARETDRRSFVADLKRELPLALRHLQQGNIAPVDFAQAAIGPGMGVYSRYGRILESKGTPMTVRTALSLINQTLTEVLSEQEDEFDADTRWAMAWFDQYGFTEGEFGVAETLSKAKNTSVDGMGRAGILAKKGGKVRLLKPTELSDDWDPDADKRRTIWEMTHHLLRVYYYEKAGDEATAELLRKIGSQGEIARDLAYRLFNVCEKKKWSQEAVAYNALVLGWPEIARLARETRRSQPQQESLL
jgi:putative DNA methylase